MRKIRRKLARQKKRKLMLAKRKELILAEVENQKKEKKNETEYSNLHGKDVQLMEKDEMIVIGEKEEGGKRQMDDVGQDVSSNKKKKRKEVKKVIPSKSTKKLSIY